MNFALIILPVSLAVLPDFAMGDENQAAKKRVYRTISAEAHEFAGIGKSPTAPQPNETVEPAVPATETGQIFEGNWNAGKTDVATAVGIGETYFRQGHWETAGEWYLTALDLDPVNALAAEGLVMSAFKAGQYNHAYWVGSELSETIPGVKEKLVQVANREIDQLILTHQINKAGEMLAQFPAEETGFAEARQRLNSLKQGQPSLGSSELSPGQKELLGTAETAYRSNQFDSALWNIEQIGNEVELPRNTELIRGWSLYHTWRYAESFHIFEKLYKKQTDVASARGIVVSLRKKADHDLLGQLVEQWGGILAEEAESTQGWLTETPSSHVE